MSPAEKITLPDEHRRHTPGQGHAPIGAVSCLSVYGAGHLSDLSVSVRRVRRPKRGSTGDDKINFQHPSESKNRICLAARAMLAGIVGFPGCLHCRGLGADGIVLADAS